MFLRLTRRRIISISHLYVSDATTPFVQLLEEKFLESCQVQCHVIVSKMARLILEVDHPPGTNLHTNWAHNDSSSDNSSVYKYWQTEGSSFKTGYLDNSSSSTNYPNSSSGRMIRLFARIYTQTNYQTNYRCLPN